MQEIFCTRTWLPITEIWDLNKRWHVDRLAS